MKTCNILGVNIAVTNMKDTVKFIEKNLNDIKGGYFCISNVHTTVISFEDNEYKKIQNSSVLSLPDGAPLSIVSKMKGFTNAERVTGPDLMEEIFKLSSKKEYKHYFYGSTQETLEELKLKLQTIYPNINIVGMYSPPFRKMTLEEDIMIVNEINNSECDFVWVGLGAPKQEVWMYEHRNKINSLMIGVGAGFDYHAGRLKRAPLWMQKCSLEWFYRFLQEPMRLGGRYLKTNFKFIKNIIITWRNNEK